MEIAAFDIGGTALKMGVMAQDGRLLETAKQSINDSDGEHILQTMLSWLAAHPSCGGIAVSAPVMSTRIAALSPWAALFVDLITSP